MRSWIPTAALAVVVTSTILGAAPADAQWCDGQGRARHDDRRGHESPHARGGWSRAGGFDDGWAGRRALLVARRHVVNLEAATDSFVRTFDHALDRSRLDGSRREDRLNERAKNLEGAADALKDRLRDGGAGRWLVDRLFDEARALDRFVGRARLDRRAERDWLRVTRELDALARLFLVGQWREGLEDRRDDRRDEPRREQRHRGRG